MMTIIMILLALVSSVLEEASKYPRDAYALDAYALDRGYGSVSG